MKSFAAFLTFVLISYATLAEAQCRSGNVPSAAQGYTGYGVPGNHYGFGAPVAGHVHHASTVYESASRGMAARVQAQAQYNLMTSLAAMNAAQAQQMHLENKQLKAEAFTAQREAYKQRKAAYWADRRNRTKRPSLVSQPQPASLAWNN